MRRPILLALALLLPGCATFDHREVAYFRSAGVPAPIVTRLERGKPLSPQDIITLGQLHVPDRYIIRHLEDNGVNYLVTRNDIVRMRSAGVSARVIDVLLEECGLFAADYYRPPVDVNVGFWWTNYPYYGPRYYRGPWW
jgi:hypothetical protein